MAKKKEAAVLILFNENDEFLVLKRSPDSNSFPDVWNFPGGGVEEGERLEEAVIREVREEANLEIKEDNLQYFEVIYLPKLTVHFFITNKYQGEVEINSESSEYRWAKIDELRTLQFVGPNQQLLNDIEHYLGMVK